MVYAEQCKYKEAVAYYKKSLEIQESMGENPIGSNLPFTYYQLGYVYL